jgi:hypothetical protein
MKTRGNIAAVVLAAVLVSGCTTPYLAEQQELALKRERGEITEEAYQAALKNQRRSQPWGGIGGVHEKPPPPLIISIPYDKREQEYYDVEAERKSW